MTTAPDTGRIPEWTFGDRVRKIRRMLGLDQRAFAEKLGEHAKTYAAWELDNTSPRDPVAVAKRIELISGVPAYWTLALRGPDPGSQIQWLHAGEQPAITDDPQARPVVRFPVERRQIAAVPKTTTA